MQLYHREGAGGRGKGTRKKNKPSGDGLFFLERVMGLPAALGQCRRQPGELGNDTLYRFRPSWGRSLRVPFPNHHFNKNIPPFGRIFLLERVMGLSAHFAAWLGSALPARALHSLPGAGKGVTGAFSYPPFESPQFQFQQKYPPIREDISVGAGNGTRTHYLSLEG